VAGMGRWWKFEFGYWRAIVAASLGR